MRVGAGISYTSDGPGAHQFGLSAALGGSWWPRGLWWLVRLLMLPIVPKDQGHCGLETGPVWGREED